MLNKIFFQKLQKEYINYSKDRHEIIKISSDALRLSKQAIFALHREDAKLSEKLILEVENIFKKLSAKFKQNERLQYEGAYKASLEEYVEAKLFFNFLKSQKIAVIKEVKINLEEYLGGLCDFTGELVRRAVKLASKKQYEEISKYAEVTDQVISELMQFNLTKVLRTKYDQVTRNLKKLEEILYEISLRCE
jgi:predicted translin family RNA/ssDNA-binding protein